VHRARPRSPRAQDVGFGYLVASLQDALMAGEPFTVWDGPGINQLATPVLATDAAELVWLALELELTGVLHCCGSRHTDRVSLARLAVEAFELEPELLRVGPVPSGATGSAPIPRDTRLDGRATAPRLGVELPDLEDMLGRLGQDLQNAREMRV
jgi:dTDP-4-dehydrorhamnose reductase